MDIVHSSQLATWLAQHFVLIWGLIPPCMLIHLLPSPVAHTSSVLSAKQLTERREHNRHHTSARTSAVHILGSSERAPTAAPAPTVLRCRLVAFDTTLPPPPLSHAQPLSSRYGLTRAPAGNAATLAPFRCVLSCSSVSIFCYFIRGCSVAL